VVAKALVSMASTGILPAETQAVRRRIGWQDLGYRDSIQEPSHV
jgi:hypothetical protein